MAQENTSTSLEEFLRAYLNARESDSSYAKWVAAYGADTAGAYQEAVRAAEMDYDRAQSSYGAKGEALGRAGLIASGYGEYLDGVAYAARAKARETAATERVAGERENRAGYAAYLENMGDRAKSMMTALKQQDITDTDIAYSFARTCGMGEEDARLISTLVGQMKAGQGESEAAVKQRVAIMQYMVTSELTRDAAYAYALSCGMAEDVAKEMAEATETAVAAKNQNRVRYY